MTERALGVSDLGSVEDRRRDRWIALLLFVLSLAYYLSYARDFSMQLTDEGYLYYLSDRILAGDRPYLDFDLVSYLPGPFWLFSWALEESPSPVVAGRSLMALLLAFVPPILFSAFRIFAPMRPALAFAVFVLLIPGPWHKAYVAPLWALLLWAALRFSARDGLREGFWLGAVVGLSFGLRIDVAIASAFLAVALVGASSLGMFRRSTESTAESTRDAQRKPQRGVVIWANALGALLAFLPFGWFLFERGALGGYAEHVFGFPMAIGSRLFFAEALSPPSVSALVFGEKGALRSGLYYGALAAVGLGLVMAAVRGRAALHTAPRSAAFLAVGIIWMLAQVPQFAWERPGLNHVTEHQGVIGLSLLIIWGAIEGRRMTWVGRGMIVLYCLAFIGECTDSAFGGARQWPPKTIVWQTLENGISYPEREGRGIRPILDEILNQTQSADRVASWPFFPGANFLTQRRMPGTRVFLTPETMEPGLEAALIENLKAESVETVVYLPTFDMHQRPSSVAQAFLPELDSHLRTEYQGVMRIEGVELLRLRIALEEGPRAGESDGQKLPRLSR